MGDIDVVVAIEARVDSALQRDLSGAQLPRLGGALGNVIERQQIRRAAQVQRQRPLREAAELALERAHIGVVDVAIVNPCDGIAHRFATKLVGHFGDGNNLGTTSPKQRDDLVEPNLLASAHALQHLANRADRRATTRPWNQRHRLTGCTRIPLR